MTGSEVHNKFQAVETWGTNLEAKVKRLEAALARMQQDLYDLYARLKK